MRALSAVLLSAVLIVTAAVGLSAEAKVQQRTQLKLEGLLGKMAGMFGGKAAKEGVVSTVAVKGNRRMTTSDTTAELVDLDAEKVYRIDLRGKSYTVQTFDEIRKQLAKTESKAAAEPAPKSDAKQPEMDVEIDVKKTGQQKPIAGFPCEEVILTVTMHEKGKTIEQGGMVLTSDMWMASKVEAMQDNVAFERRYIDKLYGPDVMPAMKDLSQALVMYPGLKTAMTRLQQEGANLSGTPLLTTMTVSGAGNPENGSSGADQPPAPGGMAGALGGLLGRKKQVEPAPAGSAAGGKGLTTILTTVTEVLSVGASAADDVEIPAGFKQK